MALAQNGQGIVVTRKQEYSCMKKLLCCKCFTFYQNQSLVTSDIRKEMIQRLVAGYLIEDNEQVVQDLIRLTILIYVCNDDQTPAKYIQRCKLNPSTGVSEYRTDLQFYLPQLCNYIVFHRSLQKNYLRQALEKMVKLNFYFAHLYYFYMKSLEKNIASDEVQVLRPVVDYNINLRKDLNSYYQQIQLNCLDLFIQKDQVKSKPNPEESAKQLIIDYQSKRMQKKTMWKSIKVKIQDIEQKKYKSIFDGGCQLSSSFQSTLLFFQDLFFVCNQIGTLQDKQQKAKQLIKIINRNLPSNAYVPFAKNFNRICNVLKIVTSETMIFQNKKSSSVRICVQIYCPADRLTDYDEEKFWTNVQTPITLKMTNFNDRAKYFARNYQKTAQFKRIRQSNWQKKNVVKTNIMVQERAKQLKLNEYYQTTYEKKPMSQTTSHDNRSVSISIQMVQVNLNDRLLQTQPQKSLQSSSKSNSTSQDKKNTKKLQKVSQNTKKLYIKRLQEMFGQSLIESKERIAQNSIFSEFKSWDIFYFIIKTQHDFKQQQFAMQLIYQLDYIFKLQKLPLILTTYEVLSMGPNKGIIEMVKDAVTFDKLYKTLQNSFSNKLSLKLFFEIYYGDNLMKAKQNFLKSLAAYCLVMYILQAKDRNNSNILLHRNGKMFHIDFSFFLSNIPSKGIQFQKDCPFKLLTQYVQVLDGVDSFLFKKFREYFFLGFKAIRSHQNKILMLVKLMYSTSGITMPCFVKGEAAITAMQSRINPPGVTNDSQLNEHCQELINRSLDNWRAKWYDRVQRWSQGIFY